MPALAQSAILEALRRSAVRATLAASIDNSQPWSLTVTGNSLELRSDTTRWIPEADPQGRQLTLSCGCALFNARVSLARSELRTQTVRFPDPHEPQLLARITILDGDVTPSNTGELDLFTSRRHTNRRDFTPELVPAAVVDMLLAAAVLEGARLQPVAADSHVDAGSRLDSDLRQWIHGAPSAVGLVIGAHEQPCLLFLTTDVDDATSWLRAGEALERAMLVAVREGFAVQIWSRGIETLGVRESVRQHLGAPAYPQVLLQVGRAPATPATRRRRIVDVLTELT